MEEETTGGIGMGWVWLIIIVLFFMVFGGGFGGLGGNNQATNLTNLERDTLNGAFDTRKSVLESQYATLLGFKDQQAQMAQCCCELKTAIHAEGEETRGLIQANTIQSLRDQLNASANAYGQLTMLNNVVAQVRPTPIPAYVTCSPYTSATSCSY